MRLYHNPRCSKSRQAVALLTDAGIDFEDYRYLSEGIHADDFEVLSTLPGIIRSKDVIGDVDLKCIDSSGIQTLLGATQMSREASFDYEWTNCNR